MKSDIEIAHMHELEDINIIAKKLNISEEHLERYGKDKAKINLDIIKTLKKEDGKLILVTSINPTPYGEGKTTMAIGIYDALKKLGKSAIATLREPSLGPVFGIKGGATGGGYAQVVPMEDINLHFTGDMHAITSANNLLSAAIDNHLFQGNELNIDKDSIIFNRCLDVNDRALRKVTVSNNLEVAHEDSFSITAASEIMAILCLSKDIEDLKRRISNIIFAFDKDGKPLFAKDLHIEEAMTILLKDAIKPNLVQTLEGNPVIIHGGPFANIAHGCSSLIATKLSLKLADYVITEAGFGADLGAEKFLDIKCRVGNLNPSAVLINVTLKSLKYDPETKEMKDIKSGFENLQAHIENMKKYTKNVLVCLNKFTNDTDEEINILKDFCEKENAPFTVCDAFAKGGEGAIETAKSIIEATKNPSEFKTLYDEKDTIKNKIEKVAKEIYRAKSINYTKKAEKEIEKLEELNFDKYPICVAKTQYILGMDKDLTVKDIKFRGGAEFITVYLDNIMTMPGLSKKPAYLNMTIDKENNIKGLF